MVFLHWSELSELRPHETWVHDVDALGMCFVICLPAAGAGFGLEGSHSWAWLVWEARAVVPWPSKSATLAERM